MRTNAPFFIVGNPRSGTNLLRLLTGGHPRLFVTESGFVPYLRFPAVTPLSLAQVRAAITRIGQLNRFWSATIEDLPAFYHALPEPTLGRVLGALYEQRAVRAGKQRWGDRTASYVSHIPLLDRLFPGAQFVHIVRDGRDTVVSALKTLREGRPYLDTYYLLAHWTRRVEKGRADGERLGRDRYLELSYETLVKQPEAEMRRLSAFLGEEFDAGMLDEETRRQRAPAGTNLEKPISTGSIGRWRTQMSPFEQKLADRLAGHALGAFGYELAGLGPMTAAERLRHAGLAAKFTAMDAARSLLYAVGLRTTLMTEARPGAPPAAAKA